MSEQQSVALSPEQISLRAQVFQWLSDAAVVTDLQGRIIDGNPAAEVMFETARAEMLGQFPHELGGGPARLVRPDGAVGPADIQAALRQSGHWNGDVWLPSADPDARGDDPDRRIGSAHVFAVHGSDGQLVGHAGVTREVTEQRHIARGLVQAERRWRSMLDVAPIGLAIVSLEGQFVMVNQALARITGYRADELTGLTFQQITHPDDLADDLTQIDQLISGQIEHYALQKRYRHADGHYVWVQLSVALIRDPQTGTPEQFVAAIEDVTAQRLASDRLTSIIAGASDAFVGIATAGYVTEWNDAAERLFGYTRIEALGQSLAELIIPADLREAHYAGLERMGRGEPGRILGQRFEITAPARTGQQIPVEMTVWHSGEGSHEFYAFIHDISARTRAAHRADAIAAAQLAIAQVELSPHKVMRAVCEHAQQLTGADGAGVELREGSDMVARAVTGAAGVCLGLRVPIDDSLSGLAVTGGETLICHDTDVDPRANAAAAQQMGARSMVLAPLYRGSDVFGVIKVISHEPHHFSDEDRSTLALLAAPFGAAMANAWHLEATAQQATTDHLTGLANRAFALQELERALQRRARQGGHLAVIFIDLDHFKPVNDRHGHHSGDQLLIAVAASLRNSVRTIDLPARYGGDEFLVICEGLTMPEDTEILAARLLANLAGTYTLGPADAEVVVTIGASIGIALASGPVRSEDLLHAADEAMYEAKQAGGNRHRIRSVSTPTMV